MPVAPPRLSLRMSLTISGNTNTTTLGIWWQCTAMASIWPMPLMVSKIDVKENVAPVS